jgi:hypothetical protein
VAGLRQGLAAVDGLQRSARHRACLKQSIRREIISIPKKFYSFYQLVPEYLASRQIEPADCKADSCARNQFGRPENQKMIWRRSKKSLWRRHNWNSRRPFLRFTATRGRPTTNAESEWLGSVHFLEFNRRQALQVAGYQHKVRRSK